MPMTIAVLLALAAAAPAVELDWASGTASCRVVAAADPSRTNLAATRLAAERVAKERAKACLLAGVSALSLDGSRSVAQAAKGAEARLAGAVDGFEVAHASYGADGSVGLEGRLSLAKVVAAVSPGVKEGPVQLSVDARKLQLARVLEVRVVDPEGRVVFAGPATYGRRRAGGLLVEATGLAEGTGDVVVSAQTARKVREAHLVDGGVHLVVED